MERERFVAAVGMGAVAFLVLPRGGGPGCVHVGRQTVYPHPASTATVGATADAPIGKIGPAAPGGLAGVSDGEQPNGESRLTEHGAPPGVWDENGESPGCLTGAFSANT